jgi:hypothetical protein
MPLSLCRLSAAILCAVCLAEPGLALDILLPQARSVFQTNETIDLAIVRTGESLKAGDLSLTLSDADGSRIAGTLPVGTGDHSKTEHLHLNAWLLRPSTYKLEAAVDGQTATTSLEIASHIRQSSFRLINWGRADKPEQQLVQGERGLGFNMFYGGYGNDNAGDFMRAGVDFMACCVMSGGHQMDLRMECDWSDPYVTRGGARRVVKRAMFDRTRGNVPGVHFYDEPGLTWHKHPATGEFTPHGVPAQVRSYQAAFGRDPLQYNEVDPNNSDHVARWQHFAKWKLGIMDAAWRESQHGVSRVRPDFLSVTQSQYGWSAFTDGYYFNVVRSLPVSSGHGGYHDYGLGYFNPSYTLEMARARDTHKPCWYLPTWYGNTTPDQFRLEQYLSFQTNIQGMMSPPDCEPAINGGPRQGIVESNQLMKRLGTIFTTMPPTKPPVALLYSLSQNLHTQSLDRNANYAHANQHGQKLPLAYLAGKLIQHQFQTVVDEDVLDGTLAADHRAIVLTGLDYLDPQVVKALEGFARSEGLVLMTADCKVNVAGAVKLDVNPRMPDQEKIDQLSRAGKYDQLGPYTTVSKHIEGAAPLAKALAAELAKAKIVAVLESDVPTIVASRQAEGDVAYLFAVNASPEPNTKNEKGELVNNGLKAAEATLKLPPVEGTYYNVGVGAIKLEPQKLRFGPGQMRVFAHTTRPIGGVRVAAAVVRKQLVLESDPITLSIAASVVDAAGGLLSGSIPLEIQVIDPAGNERYQLYRATKQGQLALTLPLAANDSAGNWKVVVQELISNTKSEASFAYQPVTTANTIAGATWRAVHLQQDRENAFRFGRTFQSVAIVKGTSEYNNAAAERLANVLKPWGIECNVVPLEQAVKPRSLTEEEAKTWAGMVFAGSGQIKPGDGNAPELVGFAVNGPVILLGNPDDNPLIAFLQKQQFLPYAADKANFPGPNRGYFAWQRDGIGAGQESITLIAYDPAGMSEAVGSFYEAVAGIDPLTRWSFATESSIQPPSAAKPTPRIELAQIGRLPDRVVGLKAQGEQLTALSYDGSQASGPATAAFAQAKASVVQGDVESLAKQFQTAIDEAQRAAAQKRQPKFLVKLVQPLGDRQAIGYWGGRLEVRSAAGDLIAETELPQDITSLATAGQQLVVGLADGRIYTVKSP